METSQDQRIFFFFFPFFFVTTTNWTFNDRNKTVELLSDWVLFIETFGLTKGMFWSSVLRDEEQCSFCRTDWRH